MRLIILSLLTLVLVSCEEILLELGSDDVGKVGEWEVIPSFTSPERSESWLVNTMTGEMHACTKRLRENGYCSQVNTGLEGVIQRLDL